VNAQKLKKRY